MTISHLDFDTPEVPALEFDDSGMPLLKGRGSELWTNLVAGVNIQTDARGWDKPAAVFSAASPNATAAVVSFEFTDEGENSADVPLAVSYSTMFQGHVDGQSLKQLWGDSSADDVSAILVGREAWLTPFPGLTVPAEAWREGREKLNGGATSDGEQPNSSDRIEVREWTVVTSAGTSFTQTYVRTGERESSLLLTEELPTYPATVLHRMYGRTVPPRLDCPSMSVPEVLALTAAVEALHWLSKGLEESVPVADKVSMRLHMVDDALSLPYTLEDDALMDEATSIADIPERRAAVASIVTRLYAATTLPGWVQVWRDSEEVESRFLLLPGHEVPPHEHAEWAGEELLALLAGAHYQPHAEALVGLAADAGEVACAQIRERLTASGLPIPEGL